MPIYEYLCKTCGEFEVTQRITDRPLTRCPTCQKKVTKLISNTSFHLKGTGWYATDYAGKGSASSTDTTDTKSEKKSDTKPEAKSGTGKSETGKSETKAAKTKEAAAA